MRQEALEYAQPARTFSALAVVKQPCGVWVLVDDHGGMVTVQQGTFHGPDSLKSPLAQLALQDVGIELEDWRLERESLTVYGHDPELRAYALSFAQAQAERRFGTHDHLIVLRHWGCERVSVARGLRPLALMTSPTDPFIVQAALQEAGCGDAVIEEALEEAARVLALPRTDDLDLRHPDVFERNPWGIRWAVTAYGGQLSLGQLRYLWRTAKLDTVWRHVMACVKDGHLVVERDLPPEQWTSRTRVFIPVGREG